ncbi:hypothetical protein GCM10027176_26440 [Actinoallomurus bryophytorum]
MQYGPASTREKSATTRPDSGPEFPDPGADMTGSQPLYGRVSVTVVVPGVICQTVHRDIRTAAPDQAGFAL